MLTSGWRLTMLAVWISVIVGLAAVWAASRQIGLSTWWLRPDVSGVPPAVRIAPFAAPTVMVLLTLASRRSLWRFGIAGGVVTTAVGVGDVGRVTGLALVEILLGASGIAVSAAAWTGTYRHARR